MQAIGMLATFDLRALGHNSAGTFTSSPRRSSSAFADREQFYGDRERRADLDRDLLVPAY